MTLRLAFMGTPDFAVPALTALAATGHEIAAVYSQPPRRAGRGQKPRPSPVQAAAEELGIEVRTPESLKTEQAQRDFAALGLDTAVVVAYGLILPKPVLEAPKEGCFNIHASLLPRWRGAAPIQRAIEAGDADTGITIMCMDEGLDTGAICLQEAVPITETTTAGGLHDGLAALGAEMIVKAIGKLEAGSLACKPQPEEGVTYAAKLTREEGRLDWNQPAEALARKVRAFSPWPGAWIEVEGERIKILEAEVTEEKGSPGSVTGPGVTVACGKGALRILRVQRQGKAAMAADDFLRGFKLPERLP
jgi:methionyl-tRNA formyltransferase